MSDSNGKCKEKWVCIEAHGESETPLEACKVTGKEVNPRVGI